MMAALLRAKEINMGFGGESREASEERLGQLRDVRELVSAFPELDAQWSHVRSLECRIKLFRTLARCSHMEWIK